MVVLMVTYEYHGRIRNKNHLKNKSKFSVRFRELIFFCFGAQLHGASHAGVAWRNLALGWSMLEMAQ